jgi:hypothetical protein
VDNVGPNDFLSVSEVSEAVGNYLGGLKKHMNSSLLLGGSSTALHWAAWTRQTDRAKLLLDMGNDKDSKDEAGRTPLSYAAETGQKASMQLQEFSLPRPNVTPANKDECLVPDSGFDLLKRFHIRQKLTPTVVVVELLLEKGASSDPPDGVLRTPLSYAVEAEHKAVVEREAKHKAAVGTEAEHKAVVERKAEHKAAVETEAELGDVVEILLKKGALPDLMDRTGRTPLSYAKPDGKVQELLQKKVHPNPLGQESPAVILDATAGGHESIAKPSREVRGKSRQQDSSQEPYEDSENEVRPQQPRGSSSLTYYSQN